MLQHGYSVVREACIGRHLHLVKALVEEYKVSLNYFWFRSESEIRRDRRKDPHKLPSCYNKSYHRTNEKAFRNKESLHCYLEEMFGTNSGNDCLRRYLVDVHEVRRNELSGTNIAANLLTCIDPERVKRGCPRTLLQDM